MRPAINELEDELRELYASIPAPAPRTSVPQSRGQGRIRRSWRLVAPVTAVAVTVSLVAVVLTTRHQPRSGETAALLSVRVLPAGGGLSCSLPIVALSADQTRGFIVLHNGQATFQPADVPQGAYITALHQWVDGTPRRLNDADTTYYSMSENPSTITVSVHDGHAARVVFTADSMTQARPMGWFGTDIVIFEPSHAIPPAPNVAHVLLVDPTTGNTRLAPGGLEQPVPFGGGTLTGYIAGSGAMWTVFSRSDGSQSTLRRYDLSSGVTVQVFTAPGFIEMVAVDGAGRPIIQVGSSDIFHTAPAKRAGITTRTLLLTGAPEPTVLNEGRVGDPAVADNLSPLSLTDGDTVWMAADNGQIWRYVPSRGMQLIAQVTTSTQGAPGVAIEGPCRQR